MSTTFIQNAKEIYNYGDIHGDVTFDMDSGAMLINGIPIEEYAAQQQQKAKQIKRNAKTQVIEALKRTLEKLEDSD